MEQLGYIVLQKEKLTFYPIYQEKKVNKYEPPYHILMINIQNSHCMMEIQLRESLKECILNFCFVPLLAFDPITKHRLGYGGGYYDRYIKKYRRNCIFIGVGHEDYKCQLPHELHDQALDLIVTNERIY
ncbi:hypothetical protein pb186bvf_006488 [Paramecium bursaria]